MRYKVKGIEIRSENAARSGSQASRFVLEWINSNEIVKSALDYGCGKLRYSIKLSRHCNRLTLVDSEIQLNRIQRIGGELTTIRDYVDNYLKNARVLTIEEFFIDPEEYDLVLCANVLSTIPIPSVRSKVLRRLYHVLSVNGICLFVTQFRNSYFKKISLSNGAFNHLDGWILKSSR